MQRDQEIAERDRPIADLEAQNAAFESRIAELATTTSGARSTFASLG